MNSAATAIAIGTAIAAHEDLADCHVYAHDNEVAPDGTLTPIVGNIQLPAICIRARFEGLSGSSTTGRGTISIDIESQLDDDTAEDHSTREAAVREIMSDGAALGVIFTTLGEVKLCGRPALVANEPGVQDRAFLTPLTYRAGVQDI